MAGIYIHIPFCNKACHYCDFHFSTQKDYTPRMVNAMVTELVLRKNEIKESNSTVYFGGGTPSVLSEEQLHKFLAVIRENYVLNDNPEITLEANPDDLTVEKLKALFQIGINRLSIGIQSFREKDLVWMNRSHTVDQALKVIPSARKIGFKNITIDLIYGIPNLSASDWKMNLEKAVQLNPDHISAYCLTIEPKTVFGRKFQKGELPPIDDESAAEQFLFMRKFLAEHGYFQYEVSNFSKPQMESKHNSAYWNGVSYLGIGPSAHSFHLNTRRWNISNNHVYMNGIENGEDYFEEEDLTLSDSMNERIMTSLRTIKGLDLSLFESDFENGKELRKRAEKHILDGKLKLENNILSATEVGLLWIDAIAADLFYE